MYGVFEQSLYDIDHYLARLNKLHSTSISHTQYINTQKKRYEYYRNYYIVFVLVFFQFMKL